MAFEKGTPEYEFFKTLKKFEEETYRLDMEHKQNCARREYEKRTHSVDSNRKSLMETTELIYRIDQATELAEGLEELLKKIEEQFSEYYERIMQLGAIRAKLNEHVEICNALSIFIKDEANDDLIEERMTEKFGNVHVWKKEFSSEFLKNLREFIKTPTSESRKTLLKKISILTNSCVRRPTQNNALVSYGTTFEDMNFEETTEALKSVKSKLEDLRLLEVQAATLYSDLQKIKDRVL